LIDFDTELSDASEAKVEVLAKNDAAGVEGEASSNDECWLVCGPESAMTSDLCVLLSTAYFFPVYTPIPSYSPCDDIFLLAEFPPVTDFTHPMPSSEYLSCDSGSEDGGITQYGYESGGSVETDAASIAPEANKPEPEYYWWQTDFRSSVERSF